MFFETWLKSKGYEIKKLSKKEGKKLYRQFSREMTPIIHDCTNFLNSTLKRKDLN